MVGLSDNVGKLAKSYLDRYPSRALAHMGDDASIALAQEDWDRFQLLQRARLRIMRLQATARSGLSNLL